MELNEKNYVNWESQIPNIPRNVLIYPSSIIEIFNINLFPVEIRKVIATFSMIMALVSRLQLHRF